MHRYPGKWLTIGYGMDYPQGTGNVAVGNREQNFIRS